MINLLGNLEPSEQFETAIVSAQQIRNDRDRMFITCCLESLYRGGDPFEWIGLQRSDLLESRKRRRNYWLCVAYGHMPGTSRRARCEDLETLARIFETKEWPQWRKHVCPPDNATPIYQAIANARSLGGKIPKWRRLYNICALHDIAGTQFIKVPSLTSNRKHLQEDGDNE